MAFGLAVYLAATAATGSTVAPIGAAGLGTGGGRDAPDAHTVGTAS